MILFDLTAAQPSPEAKFHGGAEYTKLIFSILVSAGASVVCVFDAGLELDPTLKNICESCSYELIDSPSVSSIGNLLSARNDISSFVSCMPYRFSALKLHGKSFIAVVHGLRELELPFDVGQIAYENGWLNKARAMVSILRHRGEAWRTLRGLVGKTGVKIITDSLHSKYSILSFFPSLNSDQVDVVYAPLPAAPALRCSEVIEKRNYFLLISCNRWVKNARRAIKAFDEYFSTFPDSDKYVVLLGSGDVECLRNVKNRDRFEYIGYVEEQLLWRYHQEAFCFVYPTLNEGFGYPPITSMGYGVPVIASSISSVSEVCGDGALYFNPYSISEIKNRILWIEQDDDFRADLIDRGGKRYLWLKDKCGQAEKAICDIMLAG